MTRSRHTGYDAAVEAADSDDSERLAYEEALRLLMGLPDFERSMNQPGHSGFHLERMRLILDRLGSPHLAAPAVHVAGTDGKGSTAAMVTSILGATGHKVGLYTSPHLHSVTERIRIGMEPIGRADFAALLRRLWPHVLWVEREGQHGPMSFFEMMTAMAFEHFRERGVDFQVVEVGLGGRLDSTNVVEPEVSVITPVSLDHVATLGSTLPLIAAEKAGIIKSGTPIVMAPQREEAAEVVRRVASERSAPLKEVASALTWQTIEADAAGTRFHVCGAHGKYDLRTRLLGAHQVENAATAVAVAETLIERGFALPPSSIAEGIEQAEWPGRLQVLSDAGPLLVVDGAHNPAAARRLSQAVRAHFDFDRVILVVGSLGGHAMRDVLAHLAGLSPVVVAVRSRHPRSVAASVVAASAREMGLRVAGEHEVAAEGVERAVRMARRGDMVLGTGSLSVAAEMTEKVCGIEPELYPSLKPPKDPTKGGVIR